MLPLHNSFCINNCALINFIELSDIDLLEILNWRNTYQTRQWMKNDQIIEEENHLNYCHQLKDFHSVGHWLVLSEEKKIGVISLNYIDVDRQQCEWGFYLNPRYFIGDASLKIFNCALNLFFEKFNFVKLIGSVRINNRSALLLNDFFGMKEIYRYFIEDIEYSHREIFYINWYSSMKNRENIKAEFAKFIKTKNTNDNRE